MGSLRMGWVLGSGARGVDVWAHDMVDPREGDVKQNGVCGSMSHPLNIFLPDVSILVKLLADVDEGSLLFLRR